jgi:hypothetical protein
LDLDWNGIGLAGALALLDPGRATQLRTLRLEFNPIPEDIIDLLTARGLPPRLQGLHHTWA